MLTHQPIMPILPVLDLERASSFYRDKLGLRPAREKPPPESAIFDTAGAKLELQKRDRPTKAEHTALTFEVADIEREVKELEGRGVRFEDYDMPDLKTEGHIARVAGLACAWFKDPEGNILCIHQRS